MFEEFNMTGFFLCDQPILSLYAVGKITGVVVDIGHAKTGKVALNTDILRQNAWHQTPKSVTCTTVTPFQYLVST